MVLRTKNQELNNFREFKSCDIKMLVSEIIRGPYQLGKDREILVPDVWKCGDYHCVSTVCDGQGRTPEACVPNKFKKPVNSALILSGNVMIHLRTSCLGLS